MDYRTIFEVSAAGMDFEKKRLDAAALNLANLHTTSEGGAALYKPVRAVAAALQLDFARMIDGQAAVPAAHVSRPIGLVTLSSAPRLAYEPGHPHADERGMVSYPGIDQAREMLIAMTALRAYEANVAAAGLARAMVTRALDIGGQ